MTVNNPPHLFLAFGATAAQARQQVSHFMATTQLVVYQSITIEEENISSALHANFWTDMETAMTANRLFGQDLLQDKTGTAPDTAGDSPHFIRDHEGYADSAHRLSQQAPAYSFALA